MTTFYIIIWSYLYTFISFKMAMHLRSKFLVQLNRKTTFNYVSISVRITYAKPVPGWSLQYWRCIGYRHRRVLPWERLADCPDTCSAQTPASYVLVHQNLGKLGWNLLLEPKRSGKEGYNMMWLICLENGNLHLTNILKIKIVHHTLLFLIINSDVDFQKSGLPIWDCQEVKWFHR